MKYGSVCSGIEAATVAWHHLGWEPAFFSEIEAFPCAALAHHYPDVPNLGDMTKFKEWPDATIDVLVGGTPCQSFSVAGLRQGLADPRGNLMLTYLAIAKRYRPDWLVWENAPGVLSSAGGRDFAGLLRGLDELGYGWAYRVLDAQYFGVAQRRRRVFVVASTRGWAAAAAVLFERESLSGHPAPSREKRKDTAGSTGDGVARCVTAAEMKRQDWETCNMVAQPVAFHHNAQASQLPTDARDTSISDALTVSQQAAVAQPVAFTRCDNGQDAAVDVTPTMRCGSNYSAHLAIAQRITFRSNASFAEHGVEIYGTLNAINPHAVAQPVAFEENFDAIREVDLVPAMTAEGYRTSQNAGALGLRVAMQVRRLTPVECERLQGFPDGYTAIPWRKQAAEECPDGPRYKALGNSMAVPVMRWIGERIQMVEDIK